MAQQEPTYDYNPESGEAKDQLRLLIPDRPTKGGTRNPARFSDQELIQILAMPLVGGDLVEAAATACEIIAMDETKRMMSVSISSGMSISRSNSPQSWLARAKQMRDMAAKVPWEFVDSMDYRVDRVGRDHSHYVGNQGLVITDPTWVDDEEDV